VHAPGAAVRISQESADGQYSIVVADDGPGFPTHSAHAAFSRGWRGPSAGAGEGMGLYVCRRGIRGYGGDVTIEDSAAGARVRIDLPLARSRALPVVDLAVPVQDSGRQDRRAIA
jgi:signal transduction histidine kinase